MSKPFNNKRILYFDTETTGLPSKYSDHPSQWPRLVQLAFILTNSNGEIHATYNEIIKPEGFVIPKEATAIHGISTQKAERNGVPVKQAIVSLYKAMQCADCIVCHNIAFDLNIVNGEAWRLKSGSLPFLERPAFCTMEETKDIVKAKDRSGRKKRTSLAELCEFVGYELVGAHDAFADVMATYMCHQLLISRGLIDWMNWPPPVQQKLFTE